MAKRYLVVFAQKEEEEGFFSDLKEKKKFGSFEMVETDDFIIYAMLGGIGKVAMAYRLGCFLQNIQVDEIINIGVAGSVNKNCKPLDTLVASKTAYHDVDVTAFGYQKGQMAKMPLYYECDKKALDIVHKMKKKELKTGLILSGDSFITKANLNSDIYENFDDPYAIDMESAVVGQVAYLAKLPYIIIRTISDDPASESNKETYEARLEQASKEAGKLAYQIICQLKD